MHRPPPPLPPDAPLVDRLTDAMKAWAAFVDRRFSSEGLADLQEAGLTIPQMVALMILHFGGPSTVTALSEHLKLSPSTTSHLIERLVARKLLERVEDPQDRRQKRVSASPDGAALAMKLAASRQKTLHMAAAALPPELQAALLDVLSRILAYYSPGDTSPDGCPPSSSPAAAPGASDEVDR